MNRSQLNFLILGGYLIVALLLLPKTFSLSKNIVTDLENLLPHSLESVKDYLAVKNKLRNYRELRVAIKTNTPEQTEKFIDVFTQTLQKELPIDRIHYNIRSLQDYAKKYKLYYFPLETFRENFEKQEEVSLKSLADIFHVLTKPFSVSEEKAKLLILNKIQGFPNGYLTDSKRQQYLIVIYPQKTLSIDEANDFIQKTNSLYQNTQNKIVGLDQQYLLLGSLKSFAEEGSHAKNEFLLSIAFAIFAIVFVLSIFLRHFKLVLAILLSTLMGTYLAYGILAFFVSTLNVNDIFLACFILGNGINTCIYYAFHFSATKSLKLNSNLLKVTLISALCHAFCYLSFFFTQFDSLYHFALLGFIGIMTCWFCGITFFPALVVFMKIKPTTPPSIPLTSSEKLQKPIALFFCVLLIFSCFILYKKGAFLVESDLTKLESQKSKTNRDDENTLYPNTLSPSIAIINKDLLSRDMLLKEIQADLQLKKVFQFKSMIFENILPDHIKEKQNYIDHFIKNPKSQIKSLALKNALQVNQTKAPSLGDIPSILKHHFSLKDGSVDTLISINIPPLFFMSHLEEARTFINNIRTHSHRFHAKIFGDYLFWVDLREALDTTLKQSFLFCIIFSLLIILVLAPSKSLKITGFFSLITTVIIFFAALQIFHIHVNFINFIGIPLSVSIGVDYVLNLAISKREKTFPKEAVITASLSTMIGYGSLLLSHSNAIESLGKITLAGEIVALSVALLIFSMPLFIGAKNKI